MVPELPLTFPDPVPGPPAHVDHVISVEAAQLLLTLRQSLDPEKLKNKRRELRSPNERVPPHHYATDLVWHHLNYQNMKLVSEIFIG